MEVLNMSWADIEEMNDIEYWSRVDSKFDAFIESELGNALQKLTLTRSVAINVEKAEVDEEEGWTVVKKKKTEPKPKPKFKQPPKFMVCFKCNKTFIRHQNDGKVCTKCLV